MPNHTAFSSDNSQPPTYISRSRDLQIRLEARLANFDHNNLRKKCLIVWRCYVFMVLGNDRLHDMARAAASLAYAHAGRLACDE